jgi:hypothetical protein
MKAVISHVYQDIMDAGIVWVQRHCTQGLRNGAANLDISVHQMKTWKRSLLFFYKNTKIRNKTRG